MTIRQAIDRVNEIKPNAYTDTQKREWLNELDKRIMFDVVFTHEGARDCYFYDYNDKTDLEKKQLLVKSPYDTLYILWLSAKIDFFNAEYNRYNNTIAIFNEQFGAYCNWYQSLHMPLQKGKLRY